MSCGSAITIAILPSLDLFVNLLYVGHLILIVEEGAHSDERRVLISLLIYKGKAIGFSTPLLLFEYRLLILSEVKSQHLLINSII